MYFGWETFLLLIGVSSCLDTHEAALSTTKHPPGQGWRSRGSGRWPVTPPALAVGLHICSSFLRRECAESSSSASYLLGTFPCHFCTHTRVGASPVPSLTQRFCILPGCISCPSGVPHQPSCRLLCYTPYVGGGLNYKILGWGKCLGFFLWDDGWQQPGACPSRCSGAT